MTNEETTIILEELKKLSSQVAALDRKLEEALQQLRTVNSRVNEIRHR